LHYEPFYEHNHVITQVLMFFWLCHTTRTLSSIYLIGCRFESVVLSTHSRCCTFLTFRFSTRVVYGMLQFSGRSLFAACSGVTESVLPICFAQFGDISHLTISLSSCSILVTCYLSPVSWSWKFDVRQGCLSRWLGI
jgi:hypothetical protein